MQLLDPYLDDLPALEPVIAHEITANGWRGLTREGEVFDVQTGEGVTRPPDIVLVARNNKPIGRRAVRDDLLISIDEYVARSDLALSLYRANQLDDALDEYEALCALAPTTRAFFNRGLVLLSMGRWGEGLPEHELRLALRKPDLVAAVEQKGTPQWRGENLRGKTLLLVHDAGFGDTIAMLRYVPVLEARGARIIMLMPQELQRLAGQLAPIITDAVAADYYCPMLSLLHWLNETPATVPGATPYLAIPDTLPAARGTNSYFRTGRRCIGIAWSVGKPLIGDYPRSIPLELLAAALRKQHPDCNLYSVQKQDVAGAEAAGVLAVPFSDFAYCGAFMQLLDEIVSIDTAAAHLAGAIGHPKVTLLLSNWASWRWRDNPFYPGMRVCQQTSPDDWSSALAQLR